MLKCIAKCSKGYDRCCFACELKDLCDEVCELDPKKCKYIRDTVEVQTEKREKKSDSHFFTICGFLFVITLAILIFGFSIIGNQNFLMMQNNDILDQQNNILLELDEQSIDDSSESRLEVNSVALTPKQRATVERIVMSESSIEPFEAKLAVAQTIYDRMHDWGYSFEQAVDPGIYSRHDNGEPTDSVKLAVSKVFDNGERIYEGGTYQFHDDSVTPYWTEGKIARGSIGRLSFYGGYEQAN